MLRPKKSLGQHFLHDDNILRKIASFIGPEQDQIVIEIGPGTGALTRHLAGSCRLIALEIDQRAIGGLRKEFGDSVEIIHGDVRNIDLVPIVSEAGVRVVGNIPYNITSDILFWTFDNRRRISDVTLLMQTEVADRLTARPRTKQYGILAVCAQTYGRPKKAFNVSRRCFTPPPDVSSTVVQITLGTEPDAEIDPTFRRIVRGLFGKRRKTIRNGLRHMGYTADGLELAREHLEKRPEELEPAAFVELAARFAEYDGPMTSDTDG